MRREEIEKIIKEAIKTMPIKESLKKRIRELLEKSDYVFTEADLNMIYYNYCQAWGSNYTRDEYINVEIINYYKNEKLWKSTH